MGIHLFRALTWALEQAKPSAASAIAHNDDPDFTFQLESNDFNVECPAYTTERALVRKIDFKVLPILVVLYLMAFLDRSVVKSQSIPFVYPIAKLTEINNRKVSIFLMPLHLVFRKISNSRGMSPIRP